MYMENKLVVTSFKREVGKDQFRERGLKVSNFKMKTNTVFQVLK